MWRLLLKRLCGVSQREDLYNLISAECWQGYVLRNVYFTNGNNDSLTESAKCMLKNRA